MKYYTSTTEYNCGIDLRARQALLQTASDATAACTLNGKPVGVLL